MTNFSNLNIFDRLSSKASTGEWISKLNISEKFDKIRKSPRIHASNGTRRRCLMKKLGPKSRETVPLNIQNVAYSGYCQLIFITHILFCANFSEICKFSKKSVLSLT